nr:hypothetical protein [Tanacetum cinerariifolium]
TITQADGAQSSRVPVPLPDDPYVAVRQAQLVDTDTESEPEEAPSEVEESQPLVRKRYRGTSKLILDTDSERDELGDEDTKDDEEDESSDTNDERKRSEDEGPGLERREEEVVPEG